MCFKLLFALLVALQVGSNFAEANYFDAGDGEVIFDYTNIIEIPKSCKGKPFCFEKGEDYPYEMIDKLVENLRNMEFDGPEERISIGSRNGNGVSESECKTNYNDSLIYYITDTNNKERVVVQSQADEHFRQIYDLTWCSEEGPASSTTHYLKGMKCVTKTMDLEFFVLSENEVHDNTKITVARATIPVCCRCELDTVEINRKFDLARQNLVTNSN